MSNGDDKTTPTIESTVKDPEFLKLSGEDQVAVLKHIDSLQKTKAPFSGPTSLTQPNTIIGGFGRAAESAVKGAYETFKPADVTKPGEETASEFAGPGGLALYRTGRNAINKSLEKAHQAYRDLAAGNYGHAAFHVAEANPATQLSPTAATLDKIEEGRYREAIGQAAFDGLTLLLGKKLGEAPSPKAAAGKIALGTGADVTDLGEVLPDLKRTAQVGGRPETVGDLRALVRDTTDRLTNEFDSDFQAIKNNRIYTPFIKQRLQKIIDDNPQWRKTPDGQTKIQAIQDEINTYDRTGWTFEEMNKERSDLRTTIRALKKMSPSAEHAARKVNAEVAAKEATADVMSETVNDWLSHSSGKPKTYYDALRRKQAALIDLEDHLTDKVRDLAQKQALHEARGPIGRLKFHAYSSPSAHGVMRAHISGVFGEEGMLSPGPEVLGNERVAGAFAPSKHPYATAGVMSLPIGELNRTHGTANPRKSAIPPPPEP